MGNSAVPKVVIGVIVLGTLLAMGLFVRFSPSSTPSATEPFTGRYRYFGLAVAPDRPDSMWLVGSYGQVRSTRDGGQHWVSGWVGVYDHLQDAVALDEKTVVAVGNGNVILRSADGGLVWRRVEGVPMSDIENKLLKIKQAPDGSLWAVGVMGTVLVSRDQGRSFQRAVEPEDMAWNDIGFSGGGMWLVGEFGRILRSGDGTTWESVASPASESLMAVDFAGPHGAIVGLNGVMLETHDGGVNWSRSPMADSIPLYAVAVNGPEQVVVGGGRGSLFAVARGTNPLESPHPALRPSDVVLEVEIQNRAVMALTDTHPVQAQLPAWARRTATASESGATDGGPLSARTAN